MHKLVGEGRLVCLSRSHRRHVVHPRRRRRGAHARVPLLLHWRRERHHLHRQCVFPLCQRPVCRPRRARLHAAQCRAILLHAIRHRRAARVCRHGLRLPDGHGARVRQHGRRRRRRNPRLLRRQREQLRVALPAGQHGARPRGMLPRLCRRQAVLHGPRQPVLGHAPRVRRAGLVRGGRRLLGVGGRDGALGGRRGLGQEAKLRLEHGPVLQSEHGRLPDERRRVRRPEGGGVGRGELHLGRVPPHRQPAALPLHH